MLLNSNKANQNSKRAITKFAGIATASLLAISLLGGCTTTADTSSDNADNIISPSSVSNTSDKSSNSESSKTDKNYFEKGSNSESNTNDNASSKDKQNITDSTSTDNGNTAVTEIDIDGMDFEFTDRDKDASYDVTTASKISLNNDTITTEGTGVSVEGTTATISAEGTYIISGQLGNGQINIDLPNENDKVQLVLDNAYINSDDSAPIYVKSADKVFITVVGENTLTGSAAPESDNEENAPNAAIYSKDDLTINGNGTLIINDCYNGIQSTDDLVLVDVTIDVNASNDGLKGKDAVKILNAVLNIEAGDDGIASTKDSDPTRGFTFIDGANTDININSKGKGIVAATYLDIEFGNINISSIDDALHSNISALIGDNAGSIILNSEDDAIHADIRLEINGGDIDVTGSYEGYEAQQLIINGGNSNIVSKDDGLNAAKANTNSNAFGGNRINQQQRSGRQMQSYQMSSDIIDDTYVQNELAILENDDIETSIMQVRGNRSNGFYSDQMIEDIPSDFSDERSMREERQLPPNRSQEDMDSFEQFDDNFAPGMRMDSTDSPQMDATEMRGNMGNTMDTYIEINGGNIFIDAGGDGIDSNAILSINGGNVFCSAAPNSDNTAIDVERNATINGGSYLGISGRGMGDNLNGGTQPFITVQTTVSAGDSIQVKDGNGNILIEWNTPKGGQIVTASSPDMVEGETYTIVIDDMVLTATAAHSSNISGAMMGGRMGR